MLRLCAAFPGFGRLLLLSFLLSLGACKEKQAFPILGTNLASPVDVAVSENGQNFYTLNADFDGTYNVGSLLTMDNQGNKLNAIQVPRMGRSLEVVGSALIATIDYQVQSANNQPHVMLFDLTNPATPVLKYDWTLDCSPIASTIENIPRPAHFAVACTDGSIYLGTLAVDLSQSQITKVRQFAAVYRALYIDPTRHLLIGFPDQPDKPTVPDEELVDSFSYDAQGIELSNTPNEVPDQYEQTRQALTDLGQRQSFQFFVYDINAEAQNAPNCVVGPNYPTCNFPFRNYTDVIPQGELRWLYFRLTDYNGAPDQSTYFDNPIYKYYRTNIYAVRPDPSDPDVFYISHRGSPDKSPNANEIVKVRITGDLHATFNPTTLLNTPNATTAQALQFTRVYGFKGPEATKLVYPSDFRVVTINNQKTVVVNNFRDLVNWVRSDAYFSIGAAVLDNYDWFFELPGQLSPSSDIRTYFQVAVNSAGRGASCSFYGNQVIFFDVAPGLGMNIVNQVR